MNNYYKIIIVLIIINFVYFLYQKQIIQRLSKIEYFAETNEEDDENTEESKTDEKDGDEEEDDGGDENDEELEKVREEIYAKEVERQQMKDELYQEVYEEQQSALKPFKGFEQELKPVITKCENESINKKFGRRDIYIGNNNYCDINNKKPSYTKFITYLEDPMLRSYNYNQFDDYFAPYEIGKTSLSLQKEIPRSVNYSFRTKTDIDSEKINTPEEKNKKPKSDKDKTDTKQKDNKDKKTDTKQNSDKEDKKTDKEDEAEEEDNSEEEE